MNQALLFMLVFALLFLLRQWWGNVNRCTYCGRVGGHDADCPRQL
jgi:hypothetical protein